MSYSDRKLKKHSRRIQRKQKKEEKKSVKHERLATHIGNAGTVVWGANLCATGGPIGAAIGVPMVGAAGLSELALHHKKLEEMEDQKKYPNKPLKKHKTRMKSDRLKGGLSDNIAPSEFSNLQDQLEMGRKVEMEHTGDKIIATEIARDHLTEDPYYYTHLAEMELKAKYEKKEEK